MLTAYYLAVLLAVGVEAWSVGQVVDTTTGSFRGHPAPGRPGVSEYLGVKYGASTDGQRRFAPPVKATYDSTIRDATIKLSCPANSFLGPGGIAALPFLSKVQFGNMGLQQYNGISGVTTDPQSEDCLRMNIWTKPQTGEARKAVMVYSYGGAFAYGSLGDPRYNGKYLADQKDVVIVSVSYRTNIFGFPNAPNTRQNLGFLDQRLALEWVRDNIAAFGGDPKRIILFGESSGSVAIDYYTLAWTKDPIISGVIPQSGTVYGFPAAAQGGKTNSWYSAAIKLGCNPFFGGDAVLACMRSKSFQDILTAIGSPPGYLSLLSTLSFGPEVDNIVSWPDNDLRFRTGRFIQVPRLQGTTDDEANVVAPAAVALNSFALPQPVLDVLSNQAFVCPNAKQMNDITKVGTPMYRYRWFGYYPNTAFSVGDSATLAYHASEVPMVFGTSADYGVPDTADEVQVSAQMMDIWTTFAKDPLRGLSKYNWPMYTSTNQQVVRLGYQNKTGFTLAPASNYDTGCDVYPVLSVSETISSLFGVVPPSPTDILSKILGPIKLPWPFGSG